MRELAVVIADTSALIAYFNANDLAHQRVLGGFAASGHLVVSPCVLAELDYMLSSRRGPAVANAALAHVATRVASGRWEVPHIGEDLLDASSVLSKYPDIGLTDAINVVLAREFRTDVIATFDQQHFRKIQPLTRHDAFRLLPIDVPDSNLP